MKSSSWFFPDKREYIELELEVVEPRGAHKPRRPAPPGWAWQACELLRAPPPPIPALYNIFRSEKNQREEFIAFYDTEPPPPPVLALEGRSRVRSGLRRGGIDAFVIDTSILHHVFMLIFIASWAVISLHGTIRMPFLSYFARFT